MPVIPANTALSLLVRQPGTFVRLYRLPLLILLVGTTADAITTYNNLAQLGPAVEIHLAHRVVFHLFGPAVGAPLGKTIQLAFVLFVSAWWRPWCAWLLGGCGVLYLLAAISNHLMLL